MYILNIAPSGAGKDAPQQKVKEIFFDIKKDHLLGAGDYVSDASLTDSLGSNVVRLDIIDEASGLLKCVNQGGATYNHNYSKAYDRILSVDGNNVIGLGTKTAIPTRYPSDGSSYASFASYVNWSWNMSEFFTFNVGTRLTFTKLKASWNDIISVNPQLSKVNLNSEALTTTVSMKLRPSNKIQINSNKI